VLDLIVSNHAKDCLTCTRSRKLWITKPMCKV
jgi:hypothetical protein